MMIPSLVFFFFKDQKYIEPKPSDCLFIIRDCCFNSYIYKSTSYVVLDYVYLYIILEAYGEAAHGLGSCVFLSFYKYSSQEQHWRVNT